MGSRREGKPPCGTGRTGLEPALGQRPPHLPAEQGVGKALAQGQREDSRLGLWAPSSALSVGSQAPKYRRSPPPPLPAAQLHGLRGISHPDADARPGSEEPGSRHGLALPQPGMFWAATYVSETPSPHLGDGTMLPPQPSTFGSNEIKVKAPTMCLAPCGAGLGNVGPADRMRLEKSFGLALPRY